jgi:tRNA(fMet)-specific endonuclease VapC
LEGGLGYGEQQPGAGEVEKHLIAKSAKGPRRLHFMPGFAVGRLVLGSPGPRNEAVLRRFLMKSGVGVLYADEQTTHHYGAVYRQLRKQGTPIPTNDMWIAALVLQHSLVLCARDTHFDALPQLPRV